MLANARRNGSHRVVVAAVVGALVPSLGRAAHAEGRCRLESTRIALHEGGDVSVVEISARVRSARDGTCVFDPRLLSFAARRSVAPPLPVLVARWVDHRLQAPVRLPEAAGAAALVPFRVSGAVEGAVVAMRIVLEGTSTGLSIDVPNAWGPTPVPGAVVERSVRATRSGSVHFGVHESQEVTATPPNGVGMAVSRVRMDALEDARVSMGFVPLHAITAPQPQAALAYLRTEWPRAVLSTAPMVSERWDELARKAYAAALHADPLVASLGAKSLGWMAHGFRLGAEVTLAEGQLPDPKRDESLDGVPESVRVAIGEVDERLARRLPVVGRLMPLGRDALQRVMRERPWDDGARVAAARRAVGRLATVDPADLVAQVVSPLWDDTAPLDPPGSADAVSRSRGATGSEEITELEDYRDVGHARAPHRKPRNRYPSKPVTWAVGASLLLVLWWGLTHRTKVT